MIRICIGLIFIYLPTLRETVGLGLNALFMSDSMILSFSAYGCSL